MDREELIQSLYIYPKHKCCDEAEYYLDPPHDGCDMTSLDGGGQISIKASTEWHIGNDDYIAIKYCPWCGIKL